MSWALLSTSQPRVVTRRGCDTCNLSPLLREEFGYSATRLMCHDNPRYRRYQQIRANSLIRARDKGEEGAGRIICNICNIAMISSSGGLREWRHLNGNENCRDWK